MEGTVNSESGKIIDPYPEAPGDDFCERMAFGLYTGGKSHV